MDPIFLVLVYALLGLMAFSAPKAVHEAKAVLSSLDKLSTMLLIFFIFVSALQLRTGEIRATVSSFIVDSLIATTGYFVYLLCANFSRCYWLGRCSVNRIATYFTVIIMLIFITAVIQKALP